MTPNDRPLILLTNDDGIRSPGLWAAAQALSSVGYVDVAAPREQSSGAGRSMPITSDGELREESVEVGGKTWKVHAIGGSPAQAVQHGILELMPRRPDLVVAGINYGENLTTSITISGTVGAALEGAAFGVPSLAISVEAPKEYHFSYSEKIDFSAAARFTELFARALLAMERTPDVDVLKVDIPADATPGTPWRVTRLSRQKYYIPVAPRRADMSKPSRMGYDVVLDKERLEPDSDVYALRIDHVVSVTPLSLDMTSRIDIAAFENQLRSSSAR